jgi:hypothetical protein
MELKASVLTKLFVVLEMSVLFSENATGDFTINFTNSMPDANYSATYILGLMLVEMLCL